MRERIGGEIFHYDEGLHTSGTKRNKLISYGVPVGASCFKCGKRHHGDGTDGVRFYQTTQREGDVSYICDNCVKLPSQAAR